MMTQLINQYLSELDRRDNTKVVYRSYINIFFRWCVDNGINASSPTKADVIKFKSYMRRIGRTDKTIDTYIGALRSFFRWTADQNIYPNITTGVRYDARTDEIRRHPLTISEVKKLLDTIPTNTIYGKRDRAIVMLLYFCALRVSEVAGINMNDIGKNTIAILGKGRYEKEEIPLDSSTLKAINDYIAARIDNEVYIGTADPLFVSHHGGSRNTINRLRSKTISLIVSAYLSKAGIKTNKTCTHSLRHSMAVHMIEAGADLYSVSLKLRHRKMDVTRVYTRYIEKKKAQDDQYFELVRQKFQNTTAL